MKESLKDWIKDWSIEEIIENAFRWGIQFMVADSEAKEKQLKRNKKIAVAEIERRMNELKSFNNPES